MTKLEKRKTNFGSPVQDALIKRKKEQRNFGIASCGYKKTTEIILDLKTARLIKQILHNKWSVNWKTRENLEECLDGHIRGCSE